MKVILKRKTKLDSLKLGGFLWERDGEFYSAEVDAVALDRLKLGYGEELFEAAKPKPAPKAKAKTKAKAK